jgi:hypothetical protein
MSNGDNNNGDDDANENAGASRSAIPLIGGAILLAQATMTAATWLGDYFTKRGVGRKVLFMAGLVTLPIRCALIIYWKDAGNAFLLSTQILDGIGGGIFGLLHPYLVADITFGSGRFNLISKLLSIIICVWDFWSLTTICFCTAHESGTNGLLLRVGWNYVELPWSNSC